MGKLFDEITPELRAWIDKQRVFFVASAPSGSGGHINCSPKGLDSFRVLGPRSVGYLDLTGSGAETIAHLRENGRLVFLFCAFSGPPKIVRLHGSGEVILPASAEWEELRPRFPDHPGARVIIRAQIERISDSCGFGVPLYAFSEERATLIRWAENRGEAGIVEYRRKANSQSIDGLPALDA